ncbi:MAG: NAD-binding protein, partial [Vicinamibacteria bacterium]|nr:NAD-binding protein [Vicinamibacteria bacterium]
IVAGMGNIGYRVVEELRRGGQGVLAIDRDRDGEFAELMRGRSPILLGDARSVLTLEKAGARKARAVVAALNDDLANLSIGLLVRREFPNVRTVLRLFDADLAAKLQAGLRFDAVLSMSAIAAATFVAAVMCPDAVYGFSVGDHLGLIVRRPAGASPASDAVAEANISAPLFCRAAGEARFHLSHAGCCAADGESLSLRWLPLTQPPII